MLDYSQLTYEDLPNGDLKLIAQECDLETAICMLKNLPGVAVYVNNISMDSDGMRLIIDRCGEDVASKLQSKISGMTIVIPKSPPRRLILKYIHENWNGSNVKSLAIEIGISERTVFNMLSEKTPQPGEDDPDQQLLFEDWSK